jgi:hypothetical protein
MSTILRLLIALVTSSTDIWSFHCADYEGYSILGCNAVQSGNILLIFQKNVLPSFSWWKSKPTKHTANTFGFTFRPWRWREHNIPKRLHILRDYMMLHLRAMYRHDPFL